MKILFFSPNSAVWIHSFPEALIAESLQKLGHDVKYITCGGLYNQHCISMISLGVPFGASKKDKEKICQICGKNKGLIKKNLNLSGYDLNSVLSDSDFSKAESYASSVSQADVTSLFKGGINIGRASLYEFLLNQKKGDLQFSGEEWEKYKGTLKNSYLTQIAADKITQKEKPDVIVTYNSLYSANSVFCKTAEAQGVPYYFVHANLYLHKRLQRMYLSKGHPYQFYDELKRIWPQYKEIPCSKQSLEFVTKSMLELFGGKSFLAYSTSKSNKQKNLKEHFKIQKNQKIVVAALSSYDEQVAFINQNEDGDKLKFNFRTQIDWVKELIKYAPTRPDCCFIVRVHPREFPNKRDSLKSAHAFQLEKELQNLPSNMRVNWVADDVSIYDWAEISNLFLVSWSSVAKEMTLLGLPVVAHESSFALFPQDICYSVSNKDEYFKVLEQALKDEWSFERIRKAYRWCVLESWRSTIDISDSYSHDESFHQTKVMKVINKVLKKLIPNYRQHFDILKRKKQLKMGKLFSQVLSEKAPSIEHLVKSSEKDVSSAEEETMYLKEQLKTLSQVFNSESNLYRRLNGK